MSGRGLLELRPGRDSDRRVFSDTGLAAATSYSYRVRAADAAGNLSGYSSVQSATTPAAPDTQPPTVPAGLSATAVSASQINLAWTASTDNVGGDGYRVERCQGAGCSNFVQIGTPTGASFNDTGLAAATSYSYRVRAADAAGNLSGYSSVRARRRRPRPTRRRRRRRRADGDGGVEQPDQSGVDGVDGQRRGDGLSGRALQGAGCRTSSRSRPDRRLVQRHGVGGGTSYSYRVRAADAAGNLSGYSSVRARRRRPAPDTQAPTAPAGLTATACRRARSIWRGRRRPTTSG